MTSNKTKKIKNENEKNKNKVDFDELEDLLVKQKTKGRRVYTENGRTRGTPKIRKNAEGDDWTHAFCISITIFVIFLYIGDFVYNNYFFS